MIERPVFIIGCPRSGTSLFYTILSTCSSLWSIRGEGQRIWEKYHHPSQKGWHSSALGREDVTDKSRRFIHEAFERKSLPGTVVRWLDSLPRGGWRLDPYARTIMRFIRAVRVRIRRNEVIRILDKTPDNCLRIPFIHEVFPDAQFIYLKRDGRANVNSLIEGWRDGKRFAQYPELSIEGFSGRSWNFGLPPGWREFRCRPLEELCAYQWTTYNEAVLAVAEQLTKTGNFIAIKYEDLIENPCEVLKIVTTFLGIPFERHMYRYNNRLPMVSVMTKPEADKWKRQNPQAIEQIIPLIRPTMEKMGYGPTKFDPRRDPVAGLESAPRKTEVEIL